MRSLASLLLCLVAVLLSSLGCNLSDSSSTETQKDTYNSADSMERVFKSRGLVAFKNTDANLKVRFDVYNEDGSVFCTVQPSMDKMKVGKKSFELSDYDKLKERLASEYRFSPIAFYPQSGFIFHFEYKSVAHDRVVIYTDKGKTLTKYLRLDTNLFNIEPWAEHMKGAIVDFNALENALKVDPSDAAEAVEPPDDIAFTIVRVKGEWAEVECVPFCDIPCSRKLLKGWIRWAKKGKLLIRFVYTC